MYFMFSYSPVPVLQDIEALVTARRMTSVFADKVAKTGHPQVGVTYTDPSVAVVACSNPGILL